MAWSSHLVRGTHAVLLVLAALASPPAARAQSTARAGSEFRVSENTVGHQQSPAVVGTPGGSYFVVWESATGDGSGSGVFGRHFDRTGAPLGPEFLINQTTTGEQTQPAVTMDAQGRITVAWTGPDGSGNGVFARQLSAEGPLGLEFQVNTYTTGHQANAHVSTGGAGLAVVWQSQGQDGGGWGVFGRLFTATGHRRPASFRSRYRRRTTRRRQWWPSCPTGTPWRGWTTRVRCSATSTPSSPGSSIRAASLSASRPICRPSTLRSRGETM